MFPKIKPKLFISFAMKKMNMFKCSIAVSWLMTLIVRYELTTLEQICIAYNSELYQFWECRQK